MCGRFTLHLPPDLVSEIFKLTLSVVVAPRYNVAPTQMHPVVRQTTEGRQIVLMKWGLIPHWAKDAKIGNSMFNARAETVAKKPAFRGPFAPKDAWWYQTDFSSGDTNGRRRNRTTSRSRRV